MHLPRRSFLNALVILALMAGFFSLTPAALPAQAATPDLFFSEYIEGSSYNKALEIYNGTGAAVDLAAGGYQIQIFFNGASAAGSTIDLSGVIANGDVFVIANSLAVLVDILAEYDVLLGSISFNGDDAVTLTKNGVVIDAIGQIGFDPGTGWGTGDLSTVDHTLVRKPSACQGDSNGSDVFDPAVEWDGFPGNTTLDLGKHTANCDGPVTQPPLLLTEIVVTPTEGEFIEIYNPGSVAVDLSNVYLTDATYATGGAYYYKLPTGANAGGGTNNDFNARFPDGASIAAGEYQTVAIAGADDFILTYSITPTYELISTTASVPNMRAALTGSIHSLSGLTNSGEVVILYTWDGASDLVADLDYALWGNTTTAVDKTGVSIDGPDADTDASPYLNDIPIASQALVATVAHPYGGSFQRQDLTEGAEVKTGGNGLTGHDETSEDANVTWCSPTTATPGAAAAACPVVSACGDPATLISAIQGAGAASPFDGATHTIEGIVVADFQNTGELNGIFVQEEAADQDADPLTSEGVFVYGAPAAAVGDVVRVAGTVDEYNGLTELTSVTALEVCSSGATLPAPVVLSPPFPTLDYLERYEGMYVELPAGLTVTELYSLGRYGEIWLTNGAKLDQPTNVVEPGAPALALQASNDLNRILLDDHSTYQNPDPVIHPAPALSPVDNYVRAGDTSAVPIVGALSYGFDYYRVQPVTPTSFTCSNPRPVQPQDVGGSLKVASFNVLNYFNGDGLGGGFPTSRGAGSLEEFQHQTAKIAAAITTMDADIVGLMEIENDGYGPDSAIQTLVDALNAIVGPGTYAFIAPGVGPVGTDEIAVGLLYQPASVTPAGAAAILDSSVDPDFLDDKNRPVIALTFVENASGGMLTVAVNHLKSKGSVCDDVGDPDLLDGQGNCNLTRVAAAQAEVDWLANDPTGSGDPDFLIIGDLNAYAMEDPIDTIKNAGYTNLLAEFGETYSYVFNGQFGYLDHALASGDLFSQVSGASAYHINADEPPVFDYELEYVSGVKQPGMVVDNQYRASDHDPALVGLNLTGADYSDLPACYGLAWHGLNEPETFLGDTVKGGADAAPEIDNSDDDGVVRGLEKWIQGATVSINVSISEFAGGGDGAILAAWIDWDASGTFDADEKIYDDYVSAGSVETLTPTVPADAAIGLGSPTIVNARFRLYGLDDSPGSASPTGGASAGEVEDYAWGFGPTAVRLQAFEARPTLAAPVLLLAVALLGLLALVALRLRRSA